MHIFVKSIVTCCVFICFVFCCLYSLAFFITLCVVVYKCLCIQMDNVVLNCSHSALLHCVHKIIVCFVSFIPQRQKKPHFLRKFGILKRPFGICALFGVKFKEFVDFFAKSPNKGEFCTNFLDKIPLSPHFPRNVWRLHGGKAYSGALGKANSQMPLLFTKCFSEESFKFLELNKPIKSERLTVNG